MRRKTGRWSDPAEPRTHASDPRGRGEEEAKARSRTEERWERLFGKKVWVPTGETSENPFWEAWLTRGADSWRSSYENARKGSHIGLCRLKSPIRSEQASFVSNRVV